MAKLCKTKNDLEIKLSFYKRLRLKTVLIKILIMPVIPAIIILYLKLFAGTVENFFFHAIFFAIIVIIFTNIIHWNPFKIDKTEVEMIKHGVQGERFLTSMLVKYLPQNYYVLRNIVISSPSSKAEIDIIVVGETGVYIVEIKNWIGEIKGDVYDQNWTQIKRRGYRYPKAYVSSLHNPVKQVKRQLRCLIDYLKKNNINSWVEASVFFSSGMVSVEITGESNIPIFSTQQQGVKNLVTYLTTNDKAKIDANKIDKIVELFVSNNQ